MSTFLKSVAAGAAGGALGLLAMKYAQQGAQKAMARFQKEDGQDGGSSPDDDSGSKETDANGSAYMSVSGFQAREGENATGALARGIYERVRRRPLDDELEERLGNWVHRGYGETVATSYALFAYGRGWGVKGGALYGLALWAFGDELMVPLLGLSKKPSAYGAEVHVPALVGHLAFGAALGAVVDAAANLGGETTHA